MPLSRRQFVQLAGVTAAGAVATGCSPLVSRVAGGPQEIVAWADWSSDPIYTLLNRMTYGPTLDERIRVAEIGLEGWIEEQLSPEAIDDWAAEVRLSPYDLLALDADELVMWEEEDVVEELRKATLVRRVFSNRQLYETMVEFWTDHFNIAVAKENCWYLKVVDDREVIRPHALGKFEDLLQASAQSPAMLIYLDNQANVKAHPNENYAREVMELHTLGVDGGYTQDDVMELARILTGWTVKDRFWHGRFEFDPEIHDDSPKRLLGQTFEKGGIEDGQAALSMLAKHPSTARYVSTKLIRRFITDNPAEETPDLLDKATQAFLDTDGDIKSVLRVVLIDGLMTVGSLPLKFKRPVQFVTSTLRQLHAETDGGMPLHEELALMGQSDYGWPTPDGPPDFSSAWMRDLLPRWRFALQLVRNEYDGSRVRWDERLLQDLDSAEELLFRLSDLLLGRPLPPRTHEALLASLDPEYAEQLDLALPLLAAGVVGSPEFQWR